jgi:hypothetical protein
MQHLKRHRSFVTCPPGSVHLLTEQQLLLNIIVIEYLMNGLKRLGGKNDRAKTGQPGPDTSGGITGRVMSFANIIRRHSSLP